MANEFKVKNGIKFADNTVQTTAGVGTVSSVSGTGTTAGLTLTGNITSTGSLTLGGTLSTPVSTINDSTTVGQNFVKLTNPSAISFLRVNADNTVSTLTASAFRTAIGGTTVGRNIFTLVNPSAVTFLQMNADNTVTALDATSFKTSLGISSSPTGLDFKSYVATAAQTTFAVTYTAPYVTVIVNGAVLHPTDYTATSGTSVILSTACAVGDIVLIQGFQSTTIGGGGSVDLSAVAQSIVPSTNITYSLGSATKRWKDLYLSGATIDLAGALIKADETTGSVALVPAPTAAEPNPTGILVSPTGGISVIATTGGQISTQNFADAVSSSVVVSRLGANGGGTDQVFYENDQTVTTSYTITSGKSALTAGPVTIASGATVTIPTGSRWVLV